VFFEFWAHAIRHLELRGRFAEIHRRVQLPVAGALERVAAERGFELLTQPGVVDETLGVRMSHLLLEEIERNKR